jgi:hypothetical protein
MRKRIKGGQMAVYKKVFHWTPTRTFNKSVGRNTWWRVLSPHVVHDVLRAAVCLVDSRGAVFHSYYRMCVWHRLTCACGSLSVAPEEWLAGDRPLFIGGAWRVVGLRLATLYRWCQKNGWLETGLPLSVVPEEWLAGDRPLFIGGAWRMVGWRPATLYRWCLKNGWLETGHSLSMVPEEWLAWDWPFAQPASSPESNKPEFYVPCLLKITAYDTTVHDVEE